MKYKHNFLDVPDNPTRFFATVNGYRQKAINSGRPPNESETQIGHRTSSELQRLKREALAARNAEKANPRPIRPWR